ENLEFFTQNRRLDRVETRGQSNPHIVILIAAVAVHAQAPEGIRKLAVVGDHRAAVAVTTERLGRKKAGRRSLAESSKSAVVVDCAKTLRSVIKYQEIFGLCHSGDNCVIGRQAEKVDRNDSFRP